MAWYRYTDGLLTLHLYLKPGSKLDRIDGIHADRLNIRIKAPAIENRANKYLVKILADHFAVPKSKIEISRGEKNRKKTVRIYKPKTWPDWFEELTGTPSGHTDNTT